MSTRLPPHACHMPRALLPHPLSSTTSHSSPSLTLWEGGGGWYSIWLLLLRQALPSVHSFLCVLPHTATGKTSLCHFTSTPPCLPYHSCHFTLTIHFVQHLPPFVSMYVSCLPLCTQVHSLCPYSTLLIPTCPSLPPVSPHLPSHTVPRHASLLPHTPAPFLGSAAQRWRSGREERASFILSRFLLLHASLPAWRFIISRVSLFTCRMHAPFHAHCRLRTLQRHARTRTPLQNREIFFGSSRRTSRYLAFRSPLHPDDLSRSRSTSLISRINILYS